MGSKVGVRADADDPEVSLCSTIYTSAFGPNCSNVASASLTRRTVAAAISCRRNHVRRRPLTGRNRLPLHESRCQSDP